MCRMNLARGFAWLTHRSPQYYGLTRQRYEAVRQIARAFDLRVGMILPKAEGPRHWSTEEWERAVYRGIVGKATLTQDQRNEETWT